MTRTPFRSLSTLTLALSLAACDGLSLGSAGQLSFNVSAQGSATAGLHGPSTPDTLVDASGNVLVVSRVEVVLRDIEFERQNDDACDSAQAGSDGCEKFNGGPLLLDLPLNGSVEHVFSLSVDSGTYDELRLRIHKPEDDGDARDQAFLSIHPDLEGVSLRVSGTFNGSAFSYTSDLNADQEFTLRPPLVLAAEADAAVTLRLDISRWFLSGATLVNPSLAVNGGAFEAMVRNNIEASIEAYRDDDRDGDADS